MLGDFFRINLPYGIQRNKAGEWTAFNREYLPLGWTKDHHKHAYTVLNLNVDIPIFTTYARLTEKLLLTIAEGQIGRDENGEIIRIWLYNDGTNPMNQSSDSAKAWDDYFIRLKKLCKLQTK